MHYIIPQITKSNNCNIVFETKRYVNGYYNKIINFFHRVKIIPTMLIKHNKYFVFIQWIIS